jgi:transcription elongation factor S-II
MDPFARQKTLILLTKYRNFDFCRDVESAIHSRSKNTNEYLNNSLRVAWNLKANKNINDVSVVFDKEKNMIKNTILEHIDLQKKARNERFEKMLQEKYDSINEKKYDTLIKCRRCGSEEVSYEEKQTRSADEAATIFMSCSTCKNRWIMS